MKRVGITILAFAAVLAAAVPSGAQAEPYSAPGAPLSSEWVRCGGPLGGLGYDVRMHPGNQDTMFVTDSFGGVFRSADGGLTWAPSNDGITTYGGTSGDAIKVFCLTIDPLDPSIVWCGLQDYLGLYKSTNGGRSWTEKVSGIAETEGLSFRGITIDPYDSDTVYAAGEISSYTWSGQMLPGREFDRAMGVVYKTDDGGENWAEVWRDSSLARYVWIDPRDTDVLYISTGIFDREAANTHVTSDFSGGLGVLKSVDGGQSWEQKNNGLANLFVGSLFMHPDDPDVLLAGCDNVSWPDSSGVFLTIDGADSWTRVLEYGVQSVEFAVGESQIAYAGNPESVYRSSDGGNTWIEMTPAGLSWGPPGIVAGFPIDFQVDPDDPDRLFTNNYGGGNFLSEDGGHTWSVASSGYTGAHVRDVAVAPYDPARVYAAARSGLFLSDDWGGEWSGLTYLPAWGIEWNVVTIDPHDPLHLLATNYWMLTICESHDGGDTWRDAGSYLPEDRAWRCFTFAPSDSQLIYGGSGAGSYNAGDMPGEGIHMSPDGGLTWIPTNDATSHAANVSDLAVAAEDPLVVYAATSNLGILKTRNGGATWTVRNDSLPTGPSILSVAIDPADTTHILAGLDDAGLYESFDGAMTWDAVAVGLPSEADVTSIVYSPVDSDLIYIGDLRSGVYRSTDGGASWTVFNSGLRTRAVNDLEFSADGDYLYAGTEGEGVYRLDGAGTGVSDDDSTWPDSAVHLHQSRANPFEGTAVIAFTLQTPANASVKVFNASGRLVRALLDEPRGAGEHSVIWDGRDDAGRSVASGVYFYRLEAGSSTETRRMVLVR